MIAIMFQLTAENELSLLVICNSYCISVLNTTKKNKLAYWPISRSTRVSWYQIRQKVCRNMGTSMQQIPPTSHSEYFLKPWLDPWSPSCHTQTPTACPLNWLASRQTDRRQQNVTFQRFFRPIPDRSLSLPGHHWYTGCILLMAWLLLFPTWMR